MTTTAPERPGVGQALRRASGANGDEAEQDRHTTAPWMLVPEPAEPCFAS